MYFPPLAKTPPASLRLYVLLGEDEHRARHDRDIARIKTMPDGEERLKRIPEYNGDYIETDRNTFDRFLESCALPDGILPRGPWTEEDDPQYGRMVSVPTSVLREAMYDYAPLGTVNLTVALKQDELSRGEDNKVIVSIGPDFVYSVQREGPHTRFKIGYLDMLVVETPEQIVKNITQARDRATKQKFWARLYPNY